MIRASRAHRRGVILIIVLIVLVVLSLSAYTFCDLMIAHKESALLSGKQIQCRALVESGSESVKLYLAQSRAVRQEGGGFFDNPETFRGIVVVPDEDARRRGCFTVLAPNLDEQGNQTGTRYGLQDESARLNLNALLAVEKTSAGGGRSLLLAIPGMTEDIADAILDWLDPDDEPREYGAEIDHYSGLSPPYAAKNGPLETVEELLLVRGITPRMLFGLDSNRNGTIDSHEQQDMAGDIPATGDASGEVLELGWSAYFTLFSQERNVDSEGNPRINLNGDDLTTLHADLTEALGAEAANFIVGYRLWGEYTGMEKGESAGSVTLDLSASPKVKLNQLLDLIGKKTQQPASDGEDAIVIAPLFPMEAMGVFLPKLMDKCTTVTAEVIPGRININQAPRAILMGIPGLNQEIVEAILAQRDVAATGENANHAFETWIAAEAIVTLDEMRALFPFINAGGDVYRAQIVGYYQEGGAASRAEVIFDATKSEPRILFLRDLSHLGRGYALETLGVEYSEVP